MLGDYYSAKNICFVGWLLLSTVFVHLHTSLASTQIPYPPVTEPNLMLEGILGNLES